MGRLGVKHNRPITSSRGESYGQSQVPESGLAGVGVGSRSTGRGGPGARAGNPKLTTNDALSYLKEVKDVFQSRRDKYDMFLDVMQDFKAQRIDTAGVIARVKDLFKGHPRLILGFNIFLPKGCEIALNDEVETPPKKIDQLEEAISFVNKIKRRFQNDDHVYESFLDTLNMYRKEQKGINEVYHKVAVLFNGHPDLLDEFTTFLPDTSGTANPLSLKRFPMERSNLDDDKTLMQLHKKQKTRAEKENRDRRTHDEDYKQPINENEGDLSKQHDTDKLKYVREVEDALKYSCSKGFTFCEKVKERVRSPADYQAFLKCLNIYSTEKITRNELQSLVADILGKYPDLMECFNEFLESPERVDTYSKGFIFCEEVKERLRSPADYQTFLKFLRIYSREIITREELQSLVADTLGKYPDLMERFNEFIEHYERAVGFLAGVTTKWNEGHANSMLVKEEDKDKEQKCKTEAPPTYQIKEEDEAPPQGIEFEEAISFVEKVKERFQNNDHVYKSFLEILNMYRKEHKNNHEVYHEVAILLNDHPDLLDEFTKFFPDSSANVMLGKYIDQLTILFSSL